MEVKLIVLVVVVVVVVVMVVVGFFVLVGLQAVVLMVEVSKHQCKLLIMYLL